MTIQVKHATSVQGVDCADKSVNAAQWNEDHYVSGAVSVQAFDALSAAVSVVAANLSAESDARIALSATVSANAAQISGLSVLVSVVAANLSALSVSQSVIAAGLSNEISARALSVNLLSAVVSTNAVQVSALSVAVSVVQANVSTLSVQVSTVAAGFSALSVLHSALSATVSTNAVQVSALSVAVSAVQANVSNLSVAHSVLSAQVSSLSVYASAISAAVSTVAANLSVLSVQVSTLSALHSTLSAVVSTNAVQVSALSVAVSLRAGREAIARVANAQIFSTSALANVSGMALSVGAGNTYAFKFYVIYQVASVTTGLALALTFPGMANFAAVAKFPSGAVGVSNQFSGPLVTSGTRVASLSVITAATNYLAIVEGVCMVSTTGTLQLQAAIDASGNSVQGQVISGTNAQIWRLV